MEILSLEHIDFQTKECVITIGMYDGVHIGHQQMLKKLNNLAKLNNAVSVVITFTNHPRQILPNHGGKSIQLLQTTDERFDKIAQFGIDYLIPITFTKEFASLSPKQFLDLLSEKLRIKILLLGYDNKFGNPNNNEYEELLQQGKYRSMLIQKDSSGIYFQNMEVSSTQIRKAIVEGNMHNACSMLGNPYNITSKVIKGFQNGRKIGFPTANISLPTDKIIPKCGVYATNTIIDNIKYYSLTNIGNNPTFNARNITIETHIMKFNKDIYDKEITIEFIEFIRDEKKFARLEDLINQMQNDMNYAAKIFNI